eukprot:scaffold30018_cov112-Isochrysis_galbana.AAC.1
MAPPARVASVKSLGTFRYRCTDSRSSATPMVLSCRGDGGGSGAPRGVQIMGCCSASRGQGHGAAQEGVCVVPGHAPACPARQLQLAAGGPDRPLARRRWRGRHALQK